MFGLIYELSCFPSKRTPKYKSPIPSGPTNAWFQFLSPETIPYGRFCWNQDCQYCRVMAKLPDDDKPREMLSCKFMVMPGMEITEISPELKLCLRPILQK
jgi:hypothetical protein